LTSVTFQNAAKAKQFFPRLNRIGKIEAVVEHAFSGSRFKIWAPKENFKATFLLSGVTCGRAGKDSTDAFANEALHFASNLVLQHDVSPFPSLCVFFFVGAGD